MAQYATVAQLLERKRPDTVNELANDDGVRQSRVDLLTNANILAALSDASGAMDAALRAGQRYSTDDLENLTGNSLQHRVRICCDLAIAYLYDRNPLHNVDEYDKYRAIARAHLDQLSSGVEVFDLTSQLGAGVPTIDGPSSVDYARMNTIADRTRNYYPNRSQRLPIGRN